MKLSFHGAALGVTGSCHLVECAGVRILIDCGLYQGRREIVEENHRHFGFDPKSIDVLLLTHAHLDHCGRIPLLVKQGFKGEIVATSATRELARIILLDSARIQEEDAARRGRQHARRRGLRDGEPLYDTLDALDSLDRFGRRARYGVPFELADGVRVTFLDAGHILGSACVLFELREGAQRQRVLFSGDLGSSGRPILRDPTPPPPVDVVVMETTYGDRRHRELQPSIEELFDAVLGTFRRGGNVIIPTFALERAQELLFHLREGVSDGRLPANLQVFLDSPMAISATQIFRRHPECYDEETSELFANGRDPFKVPGLHFTHDTSESMAINAVTGGAIIMAGSGMCTGGRVRHHLKHHLWRQNSSVVFVGYAAQGTLARRIIDGAQSVSLFGERIAVRAQIFTINGFSAHADQAELLAWHRSARPGRTFLVHGEEHVMEKFAPHLPSTRVEIPKPHESFEL